MAINFLVQLQILLYIEPDPETHPYEETIQKEFLSPHLPRFSEHFDKFWSAFFTHFGYTYSARDFLGQFISLGA